MEININKNKFKNGADYQIFISGQQTHSATKNQFLPDINLVELNSNSPVITLKKKFAFFAAKYGITRLDNSILEFKTKSFWKSHFQCVSGTDIYDIYGSDMGRKCSVNKNNIQLAEWTWINGGNYTIIANDDCDYILIISFCLIVDDYRSKEFDDKI